MPEQNTEVVRRMYEAFYAGDIAGTLAHFDPDVVVDVTRRVDGEMGRGHDELNAIIGRWLGAFEEWHEDIEELQGLGSRVYVVATQRGRGKGSGIDTESRYGVLYELRDGLITSMTLYPDPGEALRAAGAAD
jgi:ketosteroid isomerase-like protein